MSTIYLFRLDDISWDMNYENFCQIRDLFQKYGVRPLIGVIPHNEDTKLKCQVGREHISQEKFWAEMRELQQKHGWAIALHGYKHVYVTDDGGMFGINPRAEFAGLPLSQQEEKIRAGKGILEANGLKIDAFMAPGHSMDWDTVKALKQNGILVVTDGCCAYPYKKKGVLFVPQVWPWPRKCLCGVITACFHINSWKPNLFEHLEIFLQKNLAHCGSFQEVVKAANESKTSSYAIINFLSHYIIKGEKKVRILASSMKLKLLSKGKS